MSLSTQGCFSWDKIAKEGPTHTCTFMASACVTTAHILLTKASYDGQAKARGAGRRRESICWVMPEAVTQRYTKKLTLVVPGSQVCSDSYFLSLPLLNIVCLGLYVCVCVLVAQSYLTLCDPMDCSPPGSSLHRIFQAKIVEWVAIPSSRGSSQPWDQTLVSCTGRWVLYSLKQ